MTTSDRSVAKRDSRQVVRWNQRFLHLRGHYAFHSTACTPATPREKGSVEGAVRYLKTGFWPARRFETLVSSIGSMRDWRDRVAHRRRHATRPVRRRRAPGRGSRRRCGRCRRPPFDFSLNRTVRVPTDGYLRHGGCFYRAPVELVHQRVELHASRDEVWICWRGQSSSAIRGPIGPGSGSPSRGCDPSHRRRPRPR